jgi:hypothetical protein
LSPSSAKERRPELINDMISYSHFTLGLCVPGAGAKAKEISLKSSKKAATKVATFKETPHLGILCSFILLSYIITKL